MLICLLIEGVGELVVTGVGDSRVDWCLKCATQHVINLLKFFEDDHPVVLPHLPHPAGD